MAAKWIFEPTDVQLLENQAVTIPCQVHGMPIPTLRWFRLEGNIRLLFKQNILPHIHLSDLGENSVPVHSSSKVSVLSDGSLRFSRTIKSDEGLYQCRASNGIGNPLSKTIRISVNGN